MIEIFIGQALLALLAVQVVTTIWRHLEAKVHEWINNWPRLKNHRQVKEILHGVVNFMFALARASIKLHDHIAVLYYAAGEEKSACVYVEEIVESKVPDAILKTIKSKGKYVYRQDRR